MDKEAFIAGYTGSINKEAISYQDAVLLTDAAKQSASQVTALAKKQYYDTISSRAYRNVRDVRPSINKQYQGQVMKPGVYTGSRVVRGAPVGRHQFIMMIPENPHMFPAGTLTDLGGGNKGIIAGAYNIKGPDGRQRLQYVKNNKVDLRAIRSYFTGKDDAKWLTEMIPTKIQHSVDNTINTIMRKGTMYNLNEATTAPFRYPTAMRNVMNKGVNSNTFTQNLLKGSEATQLGKFTGFGPGTNLRIDDKLFNQFIPEQAAALKQVPAGKPVKKSTFGSVLKLLKRVRL